MSRLCSEYFQEYHMMGGEVRSYRWLPESFLNTQSARIAASCQVALKILPDTELTYTQDKTFGLLLCWISVRSQWTEFNTLHLSQAQQATRCDQYQQGEKKDTMM